MAGITSHIVPHIAMSYSQGVNTVFIVEVIGLILCPVGKVAKLSVCPDKSSLYISVTQSNPSLGAIQAMLHVDILFLISNSDEVTVVRLAGFLSVCPALT